MDDGCLRNACARSETKEPERALQTKSNQGVPLPLPPPLSYSFPCLPASPGVPGSAWSADALLFSVLDLDEAAGGLRGNREIMAEHAHLRLELDDPGDGGGAPQAPVVWSESDALVGKRRIARDDSTTDIGLQLIRGTLERMSSKQAKTRQSPPAIRPTPIQLALWPTLLASEQNVVGVASTGSGKVSKVSANFVDMKSTKRLHSRHSRTLYLSLPNVSAVF